MSQFPPQLTVDDNSSEPPRPPVSFHFVLSRPFVLFVVFVVVVDVALVLVDVGT